MQFINKLFRTAAVVATALILAAGVAFAWDDDDDIQEIRRERTHQMQDVSETEPPEAAVAEEPAAFEAAETGGGGKFTGTNEITIIERSVSEVPVTDTSKAEEEKNRYAVNTRLGFGNSICLGASFGISVSEADHIEVGLNTGLGWGDNGYTTSFIEMLFFYSKHFNISDDGILNWYAGAGVAGGNYGVKGRKLDELNERYVTDKNRDWRAGAGAQFGLEVNLSFIDPDHSLYTLKDITLSADVRPMFYFPEIKNYPKIIFTVGLSFKYNL